jgi:hypothetical protein
MYIAQHMKKLEILLLFCLSLTFTVQAQQTDPEKLQAAIDSETFVFEANQASGMKGQMIQLTPGYTLNVSPGKVVGDLPFFGRSYQATPASGDGGMKFEFVEFDFLVKPRKKGGWDITIEPTEQSDVRSIYLTVQKSGSASLRINSNSKENMSYNGYIKE